MDFFEGFWLQTWNADISCFITRWDWEGSDFVVRGDGINELWLSLTRSNEPLSYDYFSKTSFMILPPHFNWLHMTNLPNTSENKDSNWKWHSRLSCEGRQSNSIKSYIANFSKKHKNDHQNLSKSLTSLKIHALNFDKLNELPQCIKIIRFFSPLLFWFFLRRNTICCIQMNWNRFSQKNIW